MSDFDIAVAHTPLPFNISGLPLVTKYHDCIAETREYVRSQLTIPEKVADSILHPIRRAIDQRSLHKTDYAIFNSYTNKKGWISNYSFSGDFSVIYNGVDTRLFTPTDDDKEEYIVFVGTTEQKGLDRIVDYANSDHRTVHIVGSIQLSHQNIVCHGRVPQTELRKIYSKAAATIHPAKFESFGNSVLESLACGTPVVTTPTCGASEVLTAETGIVTTKIIEGVNKIANLKPNVCREVAKKYQWERVARQTESIFEATADL